MRALWSGSLSFGLINIPVKLYSAAEERGLSLDMLDKTTHKPIAYARVIRGTSKEVKWENIVKGYKYRGGDYIVLLDEDFKRVRPNKTQSIDIVSFSDEAEIDTMFYEKPYYLEPDARSMKAYALLREALAHSKKVAVASFVLREREHVAVIKPEGNILVLNQLRFEEEIRSAAGLKIPERESFKAAELETAIALVEHLTAHFDASKFKDTYTDDLLKIIEAKAKGRKPKLSLVEPTEPTEDADDLLSILRQSLSAGKKGKPAAGAKASGASTKSAAAKSAAARLVAAKAPAAKAAAQPAAAKPAPAAGAAARKSSPKPAATRRPAAGGARSSAAAGKTARAGG